jgi:hypothetical protein
MASLKMGKGRTNCWISGQEKSQKLIGQSWPSELKENGSASASYFCGALSFTGTNSGDFRVKKACWRLVNITLGASHTT